MTVTAAELAFAIRLLRPYRNEPLTRPTVMLAVAFARVILARQEVRS